MKIKEPKNKNYCASVVEIKQLVELENCDNVVAAIIYGNQVIVSKETKVGNVGLYFPLETQLSKEYLSTNNLYRKKELNSDPNKAGYFEENGRIRCVKFRGNKSEGIFMPIESISEFIDKGDSLKIDDEFDELNGTPICNKYIPKYIKAQGSGNGKKKEGRKPKVSKIIDGQFRFHQDTSMLYKNTHRINPNDTISITYKIHGTSGISSKILCKKKLTWFERVLKRFRVNIIDKQYDYINSSRKVIKNDDLNSNPWGYYKEDIWSLADEYLRDFLQDGMIIYYEIAGYLPSGRLIQKDYDYGCEFDSSKDYSKMSSLDMVNLKLFKIFVYRITYTNPSDKVFEFSAKQVQDWCKFNGIESVPEQYYGKSCFLGGIKATEENFGEDFLEYIKAVYNEKDCYMCNNIVPEEGVVIRIEGNDFEAYKAKSNRFYERETKQLDKGEVDLETEN